MQRARASGLPRRLLAAAFSLACVLAQTRARAEPVAHAAGIEVWQLGAPLRAIAQSEDGYLWLGTDAALTRFDGVRFEPVAVPTAGVRRIAMDRNGLMWVGDARGGLARVDAKGATLISRAAAAPSGPVEALIAGEGGPWVAFANGLARVGQDGTVTRAPVDVAHPSSLARTPAALLVGHEAGVTAIDGDAPELAGARVEALLADAGRLWIAHAGGSIALVSDGQVRTFDLGTGVGGTIAALASDGASGVWAGGDGGLVHIANGIARPLTDRDGLPENAVTALLYDREGNLWVGTASGFLARLAGRRAMTFTYAEGLLGRVSFAIGETNDGNVWASTSEGLHRFGLHEFRSFRKGLEVPSWCIRSLAGAADGGLWIGTCDVGLVHFRPGERSRIYGPRPNGAGELGTDDVRGMVVARDGTLWLGTAEGQVYSVRDGRFTLELDGERCAPALKDDGKSCRFEVSAILERRDGSVWIAQHGNGLARLKPGPLRRYTRADGLVSDNVVALHEDATGALWVGGDGAGLARLGADGRIVPVPALGPNVYGITEDGTGALWLSSDKGITVVARADLDRWIATPSGRIPKRLLGRGDGMISEINRFGFQSSALRSRDGRLWFPNDAGVVIFAPPETERRTTPDAVLIEGLRYDREAADLGAARAGTLELPPGRGDFELRYTVPRFEAPHLVRFQYRLVGYDRDWVDAQDRRTAFYTNIAPGKYAFEVRAVDEGRAVAPLGAKIAFRVRPHFHQTWAFYLLCAGAVALLGFSVHRVRVLQVRRTFRALLAERTRIARDLHDSLAQGFTGVGYQLNRLAERLHDAPSETQSMLTQAAEMVRYCQVEARQTIWNLRSSTVDARSFDSALRELANQAKKAAMEELVIDVRAAALTLPMSVEEQLLRIAQEATTNAIAHGHATSIQITFELDDAGDGVLVVRDDGRGFESTTAAREGHFGLVGMRERAARLGGALQVSSAPGAGTSVELRVPGDRLRREVPL